LVAVVALAVHLVVFAVSFLLLCLCLCGGFRLCSLNDKSGAGYGAFQSRSGQQSIQRFVYRHLAADSGSGFAFDEFTRGKNLHPGLF
jgi:hypothetical protein